MENIPGGGRFQSEKRWNVILVGIPGWTERYRTMVQEKSKYRLALLPGRDELLCEQYCSSRMSNIPWPQHHNLPRFPLLTLVALFQLDRDGSDMIQAPYRKMPCARTQDAYDYTRFVSHYESKDRQREPMTAELSTSRCTTLSYFCMFSIRAVPGWRNVSRLGEWG